MESTCHGGTKLARYNLITMSLILGWEDLLSGLTGGRIVVCSCLSEDGWVRLPVTESGTPGRSSLY
jgi:hypothetical protein